VPLSRTNMASKNEKIVIHRKPETGVRRIVHVNAETHKIIRNLCVASGMSCADLLDLLVPFGVQHLEIQD